jgi:hypothetical protein
MLVVSAVLLTFCCLSALFIGDVRVLAGGYLVGEMAGLAVGILAIRRFNRGDRSGSRWALSDSSSGEGGLE